MSAVSPVGTGSVPDSVGRLLPGLARLAIASHIGAEAPSESPSEPLRQTRHAEAAEVQGVLRAPGATFVTLHTDGRLHGCIGSLEPRRSLLDDVEGNAVAAAVRDRRFPALTPDELARTDIEVSVLSPTTPLAVATEAEAVALLRPGVDGVVLRWRDRRATFLPSVWSSLPDPHEFLEQLRLKADIPQTGWSDEIGLETYTVGVFEGRP